MPGPHCSSLIEHENPGPEWRTRNLATSGIGRQLLPHFSAVPHWQYRTDGQSARTSKCDVPATSFLNHAGPFLFLSVPHLTLKTTGSRRSPRKFATNFSPAQCNISVPNPTLQQPDKWTCSSRFMLSAEWALPSRELPVCRIARRDLFFRFSLARAHNFCPGVQLGTYILFPIPAAV
jgi:hypothetical protein